MSAQWNASTQAYADCWYCHGDGNKWQRMTEWRVCPYCVKRRIDELERAILMHVQVSRGTYTHITPSDTIATLALLVAHLEKGVET